jgi:serine/threonine-protein kinase
MSQHIVYEFAGYTADPLTRRLSRGDEMLTLTPKAFETLIFLIENRGEVVSKNTLMDAVSADTAVEENNLTQQIATLRRALGERAGDHRFIVTLPGKGYRFVPVVQTRDVAAYEEIEMVRTLRSDVTIDVDAGGVGRFLPSHYFERGRLLGSFIASAYVIVVSVIAFWPLVSGSVEVQPQSVAILSFRVDSTEDERLGAGIRDTLRARIGNLADVELKPASVNINPNDAMIAAREAHADVVFSGSIQRDAERIRVAVEMIDVKKERVVWGRTFDRNGLHSFDLQDAIANEVVNAIKLPS